MTPSEVNATNQEEVWQRLYGDESEGIPKYRVGDCVRISTLYTTEDNIISRNGRAKYDFMSGDVSLLFD